MKHWQCYGSLRKTSCNNVEITRYSVIDKTCPECGGKMSLFYEKEDVSLEQDNI